MQPIKRFTRCSSLSMLFSIFIILFGVSSTALTTFGKSNPNTLQPTPPPVKGRDCNTHIDCSTLRSTSCVKDPYDGHMRCLCGDNLAPINGQCSARYKGLRHMCFRDSDCDEGMICRQNNLTKSSWVNSGKTSYHDSNVKICFCDTENGYEESFDDSACNRGAVSLHKLPICIVSLVSCFVLSSTKLRSFSVI